MPSEPVPLPHDVPAHEIGPGVRGFWAALPREGRFLLSTVALQHLGRGMTLPFTVIYLHEVRGLSLETAGTVMGLIAVVAALYGPLSGVLVDRLERTGSGKIRRVLPDAALPAATRHAAERQDHA